MGAKRAEEIEVNDEMVAKAASDINEVLKPDPLLDLKKPGEELQKEVEELFPHIRKGDKLAIDTWVTLEALGWEQAKPEKPAIAPAVTPDKAKSVKEESKAKEKKPAKQVKEKKASAKTPAGKYGETCKITVLAKENPKKTGSSSHKRFELYGKCKTVADFLKAGGLRCDLSWDSSRKFIKVG